MKTYEVIHPTIKEIVVGDKFITNEGHIVKFIEEDKFISDFKFLMIELNNASYTERIYNDKLQNYTLRDRDIKYKCISLKDKINLL